MWADMQESCKSPLDGYEQAGESERLLVPGVGIVYLFGRGRRSIDRSAQRPSVRDVMAQIGEILREKG